MEKTERIIEQYNAQIRDVEVFLCIARDSELQTDQLRKLEKMSGDLTITKAKAVAEKDENLANLILGYQCVAAALWHELSMWLLLKAEEPEEAWDHLVDAQSAIASAARAHKGFWNAHRQANRLDLIEHLLFPPQVFVSSGLIVGREECSICGSAYGECQHIKGMPYFGEFCRVIAKDVEVDHLSIVETPADKACRIVSFHTEEGVRNRMTWKIDKTAESKYEPSVLITNTTALRFRN